MRAAVLLLLLPAASSHGAALAPWGHRLDAVVRAELARHQGDELHPANIAIYVSDVARGEHWGFHDDVPMFLASGVKLLYLAEAYRQREAGLLSFHELLTYGAADARDGSPVLSKRPFGTRLPVAELIEFMVRDSDNAAADVLARRIGVDNVRRHIVERFGALGTVTDILDLRRGVYRSLDPRADSLTPVQLRDVAWGPGYPPRLDLLQRHIGLPFGRYHDGDLDQAYSVYYLTGRNHAPMRTIGRLLEAIASRTFVSSVACDEMLSLMDHVKTSARRVEGALPEGVPVAHKTGTQHKRVVDFAIITLPNGAPLIVAAAVAGGDRVLAEDVIARLSRAAYDAARAPR